MCLPLSLRRSGAHKLSITFTRTPPHPHRHTLSATPEQLAHTSVIIIFAFFTSLQHITSYYLVIYTSHATLIFSLSVNTRTSACSFLPHASKVPPISTWRRCLAGHRRFSGSCCILDSRSVVAEWADEAVRFPKPAAWFPEERIDKMETIWKVLIVEILEIKVMAWVKKKSREPQVIYSIVFVKEIVHSINFSIRACWFTYNRSSNGISSNIGCCDYKGSNCMITNEATI